jgi:hypothetical protein
MSESNEQSKPGKQRASRASSMLMARSLRKLLRQKVPNSAQPNSKEIWAEKVGANLISIASEKRSAVGLQAIKMVMDHVSEPIPLAGVGDESEAPISKAALRAKSDEELDAEIKELRARLGSIVTANA